MKYHPRISLIQFPDSEPYSDYNCDNERESRNELIKLSQINLFIGANNSGKSRLMRALSGAKTLPIGAEGASRASLAELIRDARKQYQSILKENNIHRRGAFETNPFVIPPELEDSKQSHCLPSTEAHEECLKLAKTIATRSGSMSIQEGNITREANDKQKAAIWGAINAVGESLQEKLIAYKPFIKLQNTPRIYIPILRGLRPLQEDHKDLYETRTLKDYPETAHPFTGLQIYSILREKLLGEPEDRELVRKYEEFLSKHFFNSRRVTLIPHVKQDTVNVLVEGERQRPIFNLGDGMQHLIVITFRMFVETDPHLFFIEEPDMAMHPGLQRALLESMQECIQHQYFMTSHSNHFLDMTMDFTNVSVYSFRRNGEANGVQFLVRRVSHRDRILLQDLGVRNSSVFLTNATIWVEGITDRRYLRAYMKKYIEELKSTNNKGWSHIKSLHEDIHYSFVEYQGSTLGHWIFDETESTDSAINALNLCGTALVIADGDIRTKGDRAERLVEQLKERFLVLNAKEIENLLPEAIVHEILIKGYGVAPENAFKIKESQYRTSMTGIGAFLDSVLGERKFAADSGTLTTHHKNKFCAVAISIIEEGSVSWDLSGEAKRICTEIFKHVQERNSAGEGQGRTTG